ncbi:flagellar P-ring protein precursor FlgI [Chitinivorax tropicus]|uniref:Flagellar P-ring protein n=1 Tax=Chitinivorax tropicus TaxID=714531 RepID=A0A840MYT2_9PROT|nr:flagellar basal body P-ring protein FlgI [Chitinivorax tropicus]MBB5020311.1 flagellar P-ring protein precursor FlgI [Chitinivorax tropicus]
MHKFFIGLLALLLIVDIANAEGVRIKDLGRLTGWRENSLSGYGLVTGLAGTGDSASNKATRQSIANVLSQFGVNLTPEEVISRNAAVVMVSANLTPFARPGDTLDITVTSLGDARSLVGGSLLVTPLKAVNGKVYALAQGPVSVGGYKYDMNGNVVQKNHPTVGSVPGGATVETGVVSRLLDENNKMTFQLSNPDFTTASRMAASINSALGRNAAQARDASAIEIQVPQEYLARVVDFVTKLEKLTVEPDSRAKVVINERTGTVVAGGDVRIAKVAITHGELKISIVTDNTVSQPIFVRQTGADVRTENIANSRVDVSESRETGFISATNNTVADLVQALTRIKTNTRDIISILRAIKAAGALHAELVVQ